MQFAWIFPAMLTCNWGSNVFDFLGGDEVLSCNVCAHRCLYNMNFCLAYKYNFNMKWMEFLSALHEFISRPVAIYQLQHMSLGKLLNNLIKLPVTIKSLKRIFPLPYKYNCMYSTYQMVVQTSDLRILDHEAVLPNVNALFSASWKALALFSAYKFTEW